MSLDLVQDNMGRQVFFDLNFIPPAVFPFFSCLIVSLFSSTSAQRNPSGNIPLELHGYTYIQYYTQYTNNKCRTSNRIWIQRALGAMSSLLGLLFPENSMESLRFTWGANWRPKSYNFVIYIFVWKDLPTFTLNNLHGRGPEPSMKNVCWKPQLSLKIRLFSLCYTNPAWLSLAKKKS